MNSTAYKNIFFLDAKYKTICPECGKQIEGGEAIVHLKRFGISMCFNCFSGGPVVTYPDERLHPEKIYIDNSSLTISAKFYILMYSLVNKQKRRRED